MSGHSGSGRRELEPTAFPDVFWEANTFNPECSVGTVQ